MNHIFIDNIYAFDAKKKSRNTFIFLNTLTNSKGLKIKFLYYKPLILTIIIKECNENYYSCEKEPIKLYLNLK